MQVSDYSSDVASEGLLVCLLAVLCICCSWVWFWFPTLVTKIGLTIIIIILMIQNNYCNYILFGKLLTQSSSKRSHWIKKMWQSTNVKKDKVFDKKEGKAICKWMHFCKATLPLVFHLDLAQILLFKKLLELGLLELINVVTQFQCWSQFQPQVFHDHVAFQQ